MDKATIKDIFSDVKAVIFDFDGTLAVLNIDFGFMREQVFDLIRQFGVKEESIRQKHALEIIDEVFAILFQGNPSAAQNFYESAHDLLHEIEMESAGEGKLLPRVEETLSGLRKKGIKVGIVTRNCADAVRRVFPKIDDFCDVFVSRNSVKNVKPHPEHLTTAMNGLNVSGRETVMVGDHILDIQAGKRVGAKTIGVLTGSTKRGDFEQAGADFVLDDASGLCALLN
jgi:phosphoglycolate phosphatase